MSLPPSGPGGLATYRNAIGSRTADIGEAGEKAPRLMENTVAQQAAALS
jgi:hypothetical protein